MLRMRPQRPALISGVYNGTAYMTGPGSTKKKSRKRKAAANKKGKTPVTKRIYEIVGGGLPELGKRR